MRPDTVLSTRDWQLAERLARYLRPHAVALVVTMFAILGGAAAELAQPWLTQQAIDKHLRPGNLPGLFRLAEWFLLALLLAFLFDYVQSLLLQMTGQRVLHRLRAQVFDHLQRLDMSFCDANPIGRLMTRATTDVDALNELFVSGVVTAVADVVVLLGIMGVMLAMSWRLALVTFAVIPLVWLLTRWFRNHVRETYRNVRGLVALGNAFLQEHISGMATVQAFCREERALDEFETINRRQRDAGLQSIFYYAVYNPGIEVLAALAGALIVGVGGAWSLSGGLSVGVMVAFLQYVHRFFEPIDELADKFNTLQAALAAAERIFALLDAPVTIQSQLHNCAARGFAATQFSTERSVSNAAATPAGRGRIEFEHVWFAYEADDYVLRDVSFTVEPGQRVGIAGETGAGKSTLFNLLLRFYDVSRGCILVDGVDVREMQLADLRGLFGLVLQDVHVFPGSVADNIALARPDAILPADFDIPMDERAANLSTGEKQLLSLARAMAGRPRVLLLDEATSSIDTATEVRVESGLRGAMAGRTVLAIAHRLSTIRDMERILVFHRGELRESGTHQELLAAGGIYFRLHQLREL